MATSASNSKPKAVTILAAAIALATTCQIALSHEVINGDDIPHRDGSRNSSINHDKSFTTNTARTEQERYQLPTTTYPMEADDSYSSDDIELLLLTKNYYSPNLILSSSFPTVELHFQFSKWKSQHSKTYSTRTEHAHRKLIWLMNHEYIERHNNNNNNNNKSNGSKISDSSGDYELAHNDFSDLTFMEFQRRFSLGKYSPGVVGMSSSSGGGTQSTEIIATAMNAANDHKDTKDYAEWEEEEDVDEDESPVVNIVPEYKNWVEEGAVTNVKNQLFCGA